MWKIYKYIVPISDDIYEVEMPVKSEVFSADIQNHECQNHNKFVVSVWAFVNEEQSDGRTVIRKIRTIPTGLKELTQDEYQKLSFIDSVSITGGQLIFHIFEVVN